MTALPKLVDLVDKTFDPFVVEKLSHGDAADPYPLIHALHAKGTVHKGSYRELFRRAVVEVDGAGLITLARRAGGWPLLVPQGEARLAGTVGPKAPPISVVLLRNQTAVRRVIGLKIR